MGVRRFFLTVALIAVLVPSAAVRADMDYRAEITGAEEDSDLAALLDKVSELKSLEDKPPASEEALRRRADRDLGRLADAAHSLGYWDAQFSYDLNTETEPAKVTVKVEPGALYHVASVDVQGPDHNPLVVPNTDKLPLKPGDPARTAPVVATEAALLAGLGNSGHPFAKAEDRRVEIDRAAHTMEVTYTLDPGPVRRFGPVAIEGLERLNPEYVEGRVRWQRGEIYDEAKVEETRRALIASGLFSTVRITPVADPDNPEDVRMTIDATERLHRSLGVGLAYNTSQGPAARAFWENRNLFGNAEYLRISAEGGQQIAGFRANFRRPDFLAVDQDLLASAEVVNDIPVAYHSRRGVALVGIERRFGPQLTAGIGVQGTKANVTPEANPNPMTASAPTQHYSLIGVPAYLKLDETDNLLNPTRGYRAQLSVMPAHTVSGPNLSFVSNLVAGSTYWSVGPEQRAILAGKLAVASLDGAPLAPLPADQRIYAGGGGSIRPYGYQLAGPLDTGNKPFGGRSSLVLNLEARVRITENIGIVPFIDGGSYYESPAPQLGRTLLYGAGLGFRYYTAFGPLRLDLATPLHKRSADSPIQIYISLGQAF
ncbi:MAG: BamA/TamA family outer membrane protein [Alphaproteobacteria bacterium]|nr:BamA/TamA family outer membrane protein [Alphaproteobacteria bacterium]